MISFNITVARTIDIGTVPVEVNSEEASETDEVWMIDVEDSNGQRIRSIDDSEPQAAAQDEQIVDKEKERKPSSSELYCPPCIRDGHQSEERSVETLGWAAATAILIFAFSNTVIVGATLVISYILYQVVITALAVMAPGLAAVFVKFASLFSFI